MTATTPSRRRSARRTARRDFGAIRQERSGRYSAHYTDPVTSRRVSAPRTFDRERDASDWLTTVRADIVRGVHRSADVGDIALRDYFDRWLSQHPNLAQGTRDQYADHLRRWVDRELEVRPSATARSSRTLNLGTYRLNTLTPGVIREWFAAAAYTQHAERAQRHAVAAVKADRRHPARVWAAQNGVPCAERGRLSPIVLSAWERAGSPMPQPTVAEPPSDAKPATIVRQAYRTLRACLSDAVRDGLIDANPCQVAGAGASRSAERRPATPSEVEAIAAAMPDRYRAAVTLAAWSGLRAGELFGLARRHVDIKAGTVRVERAMKTRNRRGAPPTLGATKTEASRRLVHLPGHVVNALAAHLDAYTGQEPDALVFARPDGSLVPAWLRRAMFHRARSQAGRDDLRWHDLRHTGATLATTHGGASIREVQHMLGHTTYAAAMTYQHASDDRARAIAASLDALASAHRDATVTDLPTRRKDATA
jgi:integrase